MTNDMMAANRVKRNVNHGRTSAILTKIVVFSNGDYTVTNDNTQKKGPLTILNPFINTHYMQSIFNRIDNITR